MMAMRRFARDTHRALVGRTESVQMSAAAMLHLLEMDRTTMDALKLEV